jgi:hypothetical protein
MMLLPPLLLGLLSPPGVVEGLLLLLLLLSSLGAWSRCFFPGLVSTPPAVLLSMAAAVTDAELVPVGDDPSLTPVLVLLLL